MDADTGAFRFDEKYLSQIPALQVLINVGFEYPTPDEALAARGGKAGNVLLEKILRSALKAQNRIQHKGTTWLFSELHRWYLDHARQVFHEVLERCLPRLAVGQRPRLLVQEMKSRWGSLSQGGTMTLNVNLVRTPRACIEYVVTHELCHLEHRNHDAGFFRLLGRVMPDWEIRKQRLETVLL